MKLTKKRVINIIILAAWMIFIFYMSGKTADASTKDSDFIINIINNLGLNLSNNFGEFASVIVRKGGHLTEYMILSLLIHNVLSDYIEIKKNIMIYSLIGVFLYACSDELHQMFVPGRAGRFTDVLIDTIGGTIGMFVVRIYYKIKNQKLYN
ncbi:MAG: VanZ family protein [Sarcina sp.]